MIYIHNALGNDQFKQGQTENSFNHLFLIGFVKKTFYSSSFCLEENQRLTRTVKKGGVAGFKRVMPFSLFSHTRKQ